MKAIRAMRKRGVVGKWGSESRDGSLGLLKILSAIARKAKICQMVILDWCGCELRELYNLILLNKMVNIKPLTIQWKTMENRPNFEGRVGSTSEWGSAG